MNFNWVNEDILLNGLLSEVDEVNLSSVEMMTRGDELVVCLTTNVMIFIIQSETAANSFAQANILANLSGCKQNT